MSDHIKVLAEMAGISTDAMRIIIAAKEQEKFICDLYGVKSLSELEQLKKAGEQAAALKWLGSRAAISGLYHSPAQLAEPAANERASDIGRPAKPPIEQPESAACCDLVVEPGQVPAARPQAETKPAESGKKANWHDDARAIADELHLRDLAAGAHCALAPMGDRVAKIMRERGIEGPQGPVSGATVKREALQGGKWKRPTTQTTTGGE